MLKLCLSLSSLIFVFACHAYDVMGIGSPGVDFIGNVEEEILSRLPGKRGDSTLVEWSEFSQILETYVPQGERYVCTGGCCSNTIKGLASLQVSTSLCGKVGSDPMSAYFIKSIEELKITPLFSLSDKHILQVVGLVTPDSQRTFFCYLGAAADFCPADLNAADFEGVRLVYIEGYTLHQPGVVEQAIRYAKQAGAKIAMDLNSMRVIGNFKEKIFDMLAHDLDIVFCNQDEIDTLTGLTPAEGAAKLSTLCSVAIVTVGEMGCWIGCKGQSFLCPGFKVRAVDTTGAGDLFAAGFLCGYLKGLPLEICGYWGNLTGSTVVQQFGAEIPQSKWKELKQAMQQIAQKGSP